MISKKILAGSLTLMALSVWFFNESPETIQKKSAGLPTVTNAPEITLPLKPPAPRATTAETLQRAPASVSYAQDPQKTWDEKFEANLLEQGGGSLKSVSVRKERSIIWKQDSHSIPAESVVVTLTNKANEESSFRALVDPKSGKVLETWDKSIFHPADVRAGFHFKLDPRSTN